MADVILIQPRIGDWDAVRSHPVIPLALLQASRIVAKEFSVKLIDTRIEPDWKNVVLNELKSNPYCIGITSITGRQIYYALEISKFVKEHTDIPIVWGGIHSSILPQETLKNSNIDVAVIGEGEITFYELVKKMKEKGNLGDINGLSYKENGIIRTTANREFCNLNTLPEIPYYLIDIKKYLPLFMGHRTLYMETSRGCPGRCGFCSNRVYNKRRWRYLNPETVIKDIKEMYDKYDVRSIYFIDDNFFVNLERAKTIAELLLKEKIKIIWEVQGIRYDSALKMNDVYLNLMYEAGLRKVHFGAESGSQRILDLIDKDITVDKIIQVNRSWARFNIVVQHNFMSGFPTETIEELKMTVNLIRKLRKENQNAIISPVCPYTPYPGTSLYDKAMNEGFIKHNTLEDWIYADYGDSQWLSKSRKRILKGLFFVSMFVDSHREKEMVESLFFKLLIKIYRPIARFRMRYLFFRFMPESLLKNLILKDN